MSTAVLIERQRVSFAADSVLNAATRTWFAVAVIGQLSFAFVLASFYGLTAWRGKIYLWGRFISHGYVAGDHIGNLAVVMHVASAAIIMLAGAVQLVPAVRNRFPAFHRWNGRLYILTGLTVSVAGVYMTWIRGSVGDFTLHIISTLGAVLIWLCAVMALRYALARNFRVNRRWALRLFLVTSGSWFFRILFFLSRLVLRTPFGFDPNTLQGPYITFLSVAQYLLPLTILELYLRAKDSKNALGRMATAGVLFLSSIGMAAGIFAVAAGAWTKQVQAAYDPRQSIADTLSRTIAASGIDQATKQYYDLKASAPGSYNFDEPELNTLGYQLIRSEKFADAIRIFQLNVEAYPKSSNVYDSLAEAYMDNGNKAQAVANYRKSLEFNLKNGNAVAMLKKLTAK